MQYPYIGPRCKWWPHFIIIITRILLSVVQRTASRTLNKIKKQRDANATVWQSRHGPRKEVRLVTLESGYRWRVRDEGRQHVPDASPGHREGTVADCPSTRWRNHPFHELDHRWWGDVFYCVRFTVTVCWSSPRSFKSAANRWESTSRTRCLPVILICASSSLRCSTRGSGKSRTAPSPITRATGALLVRSGTANIAHRLCNNVSHKSVVFRPEKNLASIYRHFGLLPFCSTPYSVPDYGFEHRRQPWGDGGDAPLPKIYGGWWLYCHHPNTDV